MTGVLGRDDLFKKIKPTISRQLSRMLNTDGVWKDVACLVQRRNSNEERFNRDDISNFERQTNPAAAMLDAWTTDVPTIGQVIDILLESQLLRPANLIIEKVLGESPMPNKDYKENHAHNTTDTQSCTSGIYPEPGELQYNLLYSSDSDNTNARITNENYQGLIMTCSPDQQEECHGVEEYNKGKPGQPHPFDMQSLVKWTDNFNETPLSEGGRFLGEGGFGKVFLGKQVIQLFIYLHFIKGIHVYACPTQNIGLSNCEKELFNILFDYLLSSKALTGEHSAFKHLAVKRLVAFSDSTSSEKQFLKEIEVLSKAFHENILQIVGFSYSPSGACIVYEYMVNGSLEDRLACKNGTPPLSAFQRMAIALGTAKGACHLHTHLNLVHRDLKSANLLLDHNYVVKIGDCGLAHPIQPNKSSTMTKVIIGTMIYMPPEYMSSSEVSYKLDAYSYGVILLELITGLAVLDETREENKDLPSFVDDQCEETFSTCLVDKSAGIWDMNNVTSLYELSLKLRSKKKKRPTIQDILGEIERLTPNKNTDDMKMFFESPGT